MIGNKSDLDAQRDVTYDEAKQFAEENGMNCSNFYKNNLFLLVTVLELGVKRISKILEVFVGTSFAILTSDFIFNFEPEFPKSLYCLMY